MLGRWIFRRKGVPFRETHHIAGEAVRVAEEQNKPLDQLTVAELHELHPEFSDDVVKVSGSIARAHVIISRRCCTFLVAAASDAE